MSADKPLAPGGATNAETEQAQKSQVSPHDLKETPKSRHPIAELIDAFRSERPSGLSPSHLSPKPSGVTPSPSRLTPSPSQLSPRPSQLSPKLSPKRHISQVIETLKLPNRELAERLVRLGFDSETACVLHVMPLIEVAWASNDVSRRERNRILHVLRLREIPDGSRAFNLVESMLDSRPPDAFFQACREVLRDLLASGRGGNAGEERQLIDLCVEIAEASGGLFGLIRSMSAQERQVITEIANTFGQSAQDQVKRLLS